MNREDTEKLGILNFKPNYSITFHRGNDKVGALDFNGPEMTFSGDIDESAKLFLEFVATSFKTRLEQERAVGYREGHQNALKQMAQPEQAPMNYYRADAEGNLERTDIHFAQPERKTVAVNNWPSAAIGKETLQDAIKRENGTPPQRTWVEIDGDDWIKALEMADFDKVAAFEFFENKIKELNT